MSFFILVSSDLLLVLQESLLLPHHHSWGLHFFVWTQSLPSYFLPPSQSSLLAQLHSFGSSTNPQKTFYQRLTHLYYLGTLPLGVDPRVSLALSHSPSQPLLLAHLHLFMSFDNPQKHSPPGTHGCYTRIQSRQQQQKNRTPSQQKQDQIFN